MKKQILFLVALLGIAAMFGCNAQKRVDASELAEAIDSMTEDTDFVVTGELTNDMLEKIKDAMLDGNYEVGLDLSKTTGLTEIGKGGFYDCEGLTSITIPDSVTQIGEGAFWDCTGLEKITVSKGNKVFDSRNNCNAIIRTENNLLIAGCKNTVIPDSVTYIGDYAFEGCTGLTKITIPDSVTQIGDSAFWHCAGLTKITIPDSVTQIGEGAFWDCTGLEKITVSKGNKVYDSRNNCNAIISTEYNTLLVGCKNTVIPDGVTQIRYNAFLDCTGLTKITIPDSVTQIGIQAFSGCTGLTSITIPNSVTQIGKSAFLDCTGLTKITIPDSVTYIGDYAFFGCTGLTKITIPDSVTYIGDFVFYRCTNLKTINASERIKKMVRKAM